MHTPKNTPVFSMDQSDGSSTTTIPAKWCRMFVLLVVSFGLLLKGRWLLSAEDVGKSYEDHFKWEPCARDLTVQCGTFAVPTDYNDPSAGTTYLYMTRIPATCRPDQCLGSVLTNYGGPGVAGSQMIFQYGREISELVGEKYDVVSWDPRGIGRTVPALNCHNTDQDAAIFRANTLLESTFEVPPDPFSDAGKAALVKQQREVMAMWEMQAQLCGQNVGAEVLKHMGTTTLVKDMERITRVLDGKDALISFYGGSYGATVADYLVNMLPHKSGKVVAFGVSPGPRWANEEYLEYKNLRTLVGETEETYDEFLSNCFKAGPARCELAKPSDASPSDIKQRVKNYLQDLYANPLPLTNASRPALLRSGMVRPQIHDGLFVPAFRQRFASVLAQGIDGNPYPLAMDAIKAIPLSYRIAEPEGVGLAAQWHVQRLGVSCADAPQDYEEGAVRMPEAEEMVDALLEITGNVTETFGLTINLLEQHGGCKYWPKSKKPVERFTGPWNATLANPILVVSNFHDPITPKALGTEMASRFGDKAVHVVQKGSGHAYFVPANECYAGIVRRYFEEGVVPEEREVFCDGPDYDEFPEKAEGKV